MIVFRNTGRKGQVEIIGLVVLVVVLILIFVVALNFSFTPKDNKSDLRKSLIANSLLNAIIKEQGDVNFRDLINGCYIEKKRNVNNGQDCLKLKNEFNKLFSVISASSDFQIKIRTEELEFFNEGKCEKGIESTGYRFKEQGLLFIVNLKLC